jgi:hypothetical protein
MPLYKYELEGTAANDQTWKTFGTLETATQGQFLNVPMEAVAESFRRITSGRAVYGHPGVGCSGPYTITKMHIEQVQE